MFSRLPSTSYQSTAVFLLYWKPQWRHSASQKGLRKTAQFFSSLLTGFVSIILNSRRVIRLSPQSRPRWMRLFFLRKGRLLHQSLSPATIWLPKDTERDFLARRCSRRRSRFFRDYRRANLWMKSVPSSVLNFILAQSKLVRDILIILRSGC